jgi:ABC-type sugar transport system substrate-binding protein
MKVLAYISVAIGTVALALAVYLYFVVAENAAIAQLNSDRMPTLIGESYYGSQAQQDDLDAMSLKTNTGVIVFFAGILTTVLALVPAIKKQKAAWIGVVFGLVAFVIGALYGTHMFS